ncbi:MAG: LamG domain-containing protein [Candidatus Poribacteria bacterium]
MRNWALVLGVSAALLGARTSVAAAISDDDLVGAWLFDNDGDPAVDSSDMGNDGEIIGNVSWADDGQFGGALVFEGDESWVSVEDDPSLHFTEGTDFTVAAWLRTEMAAGDPPMIVAKNYQPAGVNPWWALYYANQGKSLDGSASFFMRDAGGASHHIAGGPLVNDGAWHHLTGTRLGDTITFYVDGVEVATKDDAGFDVGTAPVPLHMMSHLSRWLIGSLDEVMILRRAFTADEIGELMEGGIELALAVKPKGKLATQWGTIKETR